MLKYKSIYLHVIVILCLPVLFLSGCATHAARFRLNQSLKSAVKSVGGSEYVSLPKFCDFYNIGYKYDNFARRAVLQIGRNQITLRAGGDKALINGELTAMDKPVSAQGDTLFVPVSFVNSSLGPMMGNVPAEKGPFETGSPRRYFIKYIILDPGHGGKDPGAQGRRSHLREKDITLQVARRLRAILEGSGIKITMTRDNDQFIPLEERSAIANRSNADLFISIHINASRSRSMRGFECYYLSNATNDNARALEAFENSTLKIAETAMAERSRSLDKTLWDMALTENRVESSELAGSICASIDESLMMGNRGIKTARFYVLKHTNLPSVLVEAGYVSNKYEEIKLKDPEFLDRIAESLARGIIRFKEQYERTEGFTRS